MTREPTAGSVRRLDLFALDVRIELLVEDPDLADLLARLLVDLHAEKAELGEVAAGRRGDVPWISLSVRGSGPWQVCADGTLTEADSAARAVELLLAELNQGVISSTLTLAFHAAVVTRGERTLVLPGASGRGKTTLTAALVQRGWTYLTDEAFALTWSDGGLLTYRRPLALSAWSANVLGVVGVDIGEEILFPASSLAAQPDPQPERRFVTDVVVLNRDGSGPSLGPIHRSTTLQELTRRAFTLHRDPATALRLLTATLGAAQAWELRFGDPGATADLLTRELT